MAEGNAYLDIVWRQFKKNRLAYWCLLPVMGLFLIAICAPLLASNVPLVFHDGPRTIYPWFNALFNPDPDQPVDFVYNMALVAFVPWVVAGLFSNWWLSRQGVTWGKRLSLVALEYVLLTAAAIVLFSPNMAHLGPRDSYSARDFSAEELRSHGQNYGLYVLLPYGPTEQDLDARFKPPGYVTPSDQQTRSNQSTLHLLGTFRQGEDVLARIIYGTRISMSVGIVAVSIYMAIGVVVGALAGYFGGLTDLIISRVIEIVLLFPMFFLILIVVGMLGKDILVIMIVIGLTGWPSIARLVRGEVLKQRSLDYALAARALGASHGRILFRHIIVNALGPALVSIPFGVAGAIIAEAGLSVLGFGVREPAPSWGEMLNVAKDDYHNWFLVVFPSLAIFFTVTIFNIVGNGLRDAMDPRLRI